MVSRPASLKRWLARPSARLTLSALVGFPLASCDASRLPLARCQPQPGQTVVCTISSPGHEIVLQRSAGEAVLVVLYQDGSDLTARLFDPNGTLLLDVDSLNGTQGRERVTAVAAVSGDFRLQIVPPPNTETASYGLKVFPQRPATAPVSAAAEAARDLDRG